MPSFPPFLLSILLLLPAISNASPINRQVGISDNVFMTTQNGTDGLEQRVCSIDAVTYRDGETIPTSSPCEHCVCRPPGFACTITSCEYRPGCKAFRRSDQCCPEYQCECEKDGKIYQNGDKIMDNNNPCEVCYCQGGEIICAVIDCYWRNDCPPRYIDNRCCPMYDHCPPPAAQGPIRHRLPTLTSPVPISWHNLTQAVTTTTTPPPPPPPSSSPSTTTIVQVITEASTSTTTTSTSTTSAPSTSAPLNDEVSSSSVDAVTEPVTPSESPAESADSNVVPVDVPGENVKVNDDAADIAPTTTQPELEASLQDHVADDAAADENVDEQQQQQTTTVPLTVNDSPPELVEEVAQTEVSPTSVFTAFQTGITNGSVPSSEEGNLVISEPTAAVVLQHGPQDYEKEHVLYDGSGDDSAVVTTSEASHVIAQDDEPSQTTTTPELEQVQHDAGDEESAGVTQQQPQFDATEKTAFEQKEEETHILADATESPQVAVDDEAAPEPEPGVTENVAVHDDVPEATTATPEFRRPVNPEELVRNDLFEVNTQSSAGSEVEVQQDDVAATTVANEELVYADEATERQHIVQNDNAPENAGVTAASVNEVLSDSPQTTVSSVQNDPPETATQRDSLLPSGSGSQNSHGNGEVDTEQVSNDDVATDRPLSDESLADATEPGNPVFNDEVSATQDPKIIARDDSTTVTEAVPQSDDDGATERAQDEEPQPATQVYDATERIDDDAQVTENGALSQDETQVTEQYESHNDGVATEGSPVYQNDEQVTTENSAGVHHDNDDDALAADEPVTSQADRNDDFENVVTEKVVADLPSQTERVAEKDEAIVQDDVSGGVTQAPPVPDNKIDVFDIILDDEVIPSQPETLNQVRESILSESEVSSLLERVRHADHAEMERISSGVGVTPGETTVSSDDQAVHDGVPEPSATTQGSNGDFGVAFNDDVAVESSTVFNDEPVAEPLPTEGSVGLQNDEETQTQRQFRDDIDDLLRHHINGAPHGDEEDVSTTIVPSQARGEEVEVTTSVSVDAEAHDDAVEGTTALPEHQVYRNKVQKVAEALQQHNIIPGSEENFSVGNKFRLESDIFGGSVESQDEQGEVTTVVNAERLLDDQGQTTVEPFVQHDDNSDSGFGGTERSREQVAHDEQVVTERSDVYEDSTSGGVTESNSLVQHDEEEELTVQTTPYNVEHFVNDDAEGSGHYHDDPTESSSVVLQDVTEGSGLARLDLDDEPVSSQTTVVPVNDDVVEASTSSPTFNSFRMDILNSLEDVAESGSGAGEVVQQDSATNSPDRPAQESDPEASEAVTEQDSLEIENRDPRVPTTSTPEQEVVQNDEAASVTTESLLSRFRTDLEIETEAPSQASSVIPEQQSDFVEVSTGAPSGFAVEYRENDETAGTQAPADNEVPSNDQAPDIIPEDDLSATQPSIPVLNLVASEDAISHDEAVTQSVQVVPAVKQEDTIVANDEPVTPSIVHDEPATEAIVQDQPATEAAVANDEPVTSVPTSEAIVNDETDAPQEAVNDEPSATQAVNDAVVTEAIAPELARDDIATSSSSLNDEIVTQSPPEQNSSNDPVIFSDDPVPSTVQPLERLRFDPESTEQQTEQAPSAQNDGTTEVAQNDDISVTTTTTAPSDPKLNHSSIFAAVKVVKKEDVILPKIQPISPDIGRNNPHQLRFDFPLPPEKDNSWLSRAVNQFRRLTGFNTNSHVEVTTQSAVGSSSRVRVPSRRFLLF